MKIIKPSIEILDNITPVEGLKKLELCGRVCYKSEDKITDESAVKFISNIIKREHESVLEHGEYIIQFKRYNDYAKIVCSMNALRERVGEKSLLRHTVNNERYIISGNVRMWRDFIKKCISKNIYICNKALTLLTYVFDITSKPEFKILFGDILDVPNKYEINPYPVKFLTPNDLVTDVEILTHRTITVKFITDRGVSHEIVRHRIASYSQESTRYCNYSKGQFNGEITVIEPCFLVPGTEGYDMWYRACQMAEQYYFSMLDWGCSPQEARAVLPNSLKTEIIMTANIREWQHFLKLRTSSAAHPQMREVANMLLTELNFILPSLFDNIE